MMADSLDNLLLCNLPWLKCLTHMYLLQLMIEILFLRMANAYLDPNVWTNGSEIIKSVLAAREVAEQAAAPDDERRVPDHHPARCWQHHLPGRREPARERGPGNRGRVGTDLLDPYAGRALNSARACKPKLVTK